jgi:deazaflavin-dependent oxidoreductase (nitroreductase family)
MPRIYRLGLWRRAANVLVTALLRWGVGPPRTYLLTVPGRRTGLPRSTPVTLVEERGGRWLVAPYGEVAWVKNARAAGQITLSRGKREETMAITEAGLDEAAPVLKAYVRDVPITRPFFDARPDADLAAFKDEALRHPVFRIQGRAP